MKTPDDAGQQFLKDVCVREKGGQEQRMIEQRQA